MNQIFKSISINLLLAITVAVVLCGCSSKNTYLGRTDATGMQVTAPLDGILASAVGADDVVWAEPDTGKTIDAVFDDDISSNQPSYRYFQYAKGIPIAQYRVGEGVDITSDDKKYKDTSQSIKGDTNPLPMLVPIRKIYFRSYDKNRWSANPEAYTLGQDYLQESIISPKYNIESDSPTPPAILFILYEPAKYWSEDASSRKYDSTPMYFDAYYSVDYWNIISDDAGTISAPKITAADARDLTSPTEFGVCKYEPAGAQSSISIPHQGSSTSTPYKLMETGGIVGLFTSCSAVPAPEMANPVAGGDIKFTLIDALNLQGQESDVTQDKVNLWTKYEFLEMMSATGNTLFNKASQNNLSLPDKDKFSQENNLQIPVTLYSKLAYEFNFNNPSSCSVGDEQRSLEASKYTVIFTPNATYYHNRTAISQKVIYERQPAGDNGARPIVTATDPLDWVWCWFTPE